MANDLDICAADLEANLRIHGNFKAFPRGYLEGKAINFATSMKWDSLDNIMILLISGLILFPSEENFMDYAAISVFLFVKVRNEDSTPALLGTPFIKNIQNM